MTAPQEPAEAEARLDDLRRRLYRADATDADRQRYLDERGAIPEDQPPEPAPERRPSPSRRRIGVLVASVVVAGLAVAGVVRAQGTGSPTVTPSAAPSARNVQQDVGDGRVLTVDGDAAGPTLVGTEISGTAVVGQRYQGYGNAVVRFDPADGSFAGGRAVVEVRSAEPSRVSWRALIVLTRTDWTSYPLVAARGVAQERSGAQAPTTFVYPSRPPTRVAIEAPAGVAWTLVVATTGLVTPALR